MRKFVIFLLLFSVVSLSFSDDADARRKRRRSRAKKQKIINEKKLYERVGGEKGVALIVDEWLRISLADQRIAPAFAKVTEQPERLAKMRKGMNDQLCEMADGPCQYKGKDMAKAHAGMNVSDDQFLIFSEGLFKSMEKRDLPEREKNEMLARLGELRAEVVDGEASGE
jgi:hemoglobin